MEEEHRKALEEEAMEQVGQAEHLEEEHDPSPEEQDPQWRDPRAQGEDASPPEGHAPAEVGGHPLHTGSRSVLRAGMRDVEKNFSTYDSL